MNFLLTCFLIKFPLYFAYRLHEKIPLKILLISEILFFNAYQITARTKQSRTKFFPPKFTFAPTHLQIKECRSVRTKKYRRARARRYRCALNAHYVFFHPYNQNLGQGELSSRIGVSYSGRLRMRIPLINSPGHQNLDRCEWTPITERESAIRNFSRLRSESRSWRTLIENWSDLFWPAAHENPVD